MVKKSNPIMTPLSDSTTTISANPKPPQISTSIELVDDMEHSQDLVFKENNQITIVKKADIKQLLQDSSPKDSKKNSNPGSLNSTQQAMELIGQNGLRSARDVMTFMKSHTGATVRKLIFDQLSLLAAMKDTQRQRLLDAETRRHRFLAFLLLAAIYKKKAHAKKLNEFIQKQIDATLALGKAQTEQHTNSPNEANSNALAQTFAAYALSAQMIDSALEAKLAESQALEDEIAELAKRGEQIAKRYNTFNFHLQALDAHYEALAQLQTTEEKINGLENNLVQLNEKIEATRLEIDRLVTTNQDEEAFELLHELNGLNSQEADMRDKLAVLKQEKSFYNADGEAINYLDAEKAKFDVAQFIVSKNQQIVKKNDQLYLLVNGQVFDSMTTEEKAQAQLSFERAKPEITNLKTVVKNNQGVETSLHSDTTVDAYKRSEAMQKEIMDLTNQHNQCQAAMASIATLMQQNNLSLTALTMIPTPRLTPTKQNTSSPQLANPSITTSFKHVLELMKNNPTEEGIAQFKKGFVEPNGRPNEAMQKMIVNSIVPGVAISAVKMEALLRDIEKFGVPTYRLNAAPSPTPNSRAQNAPTAPNPFSTKPPRL